MSYKNDDLDKLFQKAGRNYPLKTDNADWAKLSEKLENSKKIAAKNTRKYTMIFLISFIAIVPISVYELRIGSTEVNKLNTTQQILPKAVTIQNEVKKTESLLSSENKKVSLVIDKTNYLQKQFSVTENNNAYKNDISIRNNDFESILKQDNPFNNVFDRIKETDQKQIKTDMADVPAENTLSDEKPEAANENTNTENIASAQMTHVQLKPVRKIYGIAYGGPEFSLVKFQKTTNPGYLIGIALGYKINDRLSIEVGLQREHLNFYSNGKYVDTSLLRIKRNTNLENVNASSKITSVPLTLRYNVLSNSNGHFFVTAGINAVIITHSEHYDYDVSRNGVESSLSRKYNAIRSPKYFSGINISAGYQTKVIGSWSMKIEPYYQAPVNDFGVGRVPVSNFGVNIGIVKDLK